MATVVSIMDRDGWEERTDNIVVVDPPGELLLWVPRDLWAESAGDRISAAFARGGHHALRRGLGEYGLEAEHGFCLRRGATERALEGATVEVPVEEPMRFDYNHETIRFDPPSECLSGERIHHWLGAREGPDDSSDLIRIERQKVLVRALLEQGFDFSQALEDRDRVDASGPEAIEELRAVRPSWSFETFGPVVNAVIDGKMVLTTAARRVGKGGRSRVAVHAGARPTPHFHRGREGRRPVGVVVHTTEGTASGTIAWFASAESGVSSHYLVSLDGGIVRFVEEADAARHAGRVRDPTSTLVEPGEDPNLHTIGIEFEDGGDPGGCERTDAQYRAGARLLAEVAERWSIPLDRRHVIGHRELFSGKSCPGNLEIDRLIDEARALSRPFVCLLPARNAEADVPGYLESVGQFADWVIALDDGSTDGTAEMLRESDLVRSLIGNPPRERYGGWDDAGNRARLLQAAANLGVGWALFLDADERIPAEDGAALREFTAGDALEGCAYGFELHRMWGEQVVPGFTWVYRLFSPAPAHLLPDRRLHFNPVPEQIPRRAWVRTTLRIQHLDGPERLAARRAKYREADPERALERRPARLLDEPPEDELLAWPDRGPGVPILDPGVVSAPGPEDNGRRPRHKLLCLVPVRQGEEDVPGLLESAARFADGIVALDDGSTDRTAEILEGSELVRRVLRNPARESYRGWDEGHDRTRLLEAAAEFDPEWILWLDSDERIDPDDGLALRRFIESGPDPCRAYGFRVFRMIGDLDHYDRAGLWVYRLFAFEPGQELDPHLHRVPVPRSIPRDRWTRTTFRIQHLSSLSEERRLARYRKYEEADPDRRFQPDYSHLLEVDSVKRWRQRPPDLPALTDPHGGGELAELDLESLDPDAPLLSAIVIARNDEERIEATVRSVVSQECPEPFEVIVVVSGEDRTAEIVRERFPEAKLIELDGVALPGRARNAGVLAACGEYVSFPGSHVELPAGSLAARLEAHESGHAMVTGSIVNGTPTRSGWASYFLDHSASLPGRPSGRLPGPPDHCSYVREFVLAAGGFPEELRAGEDTVVNNRLSRRGHDAYRAQEAQLVHRSPCANPWRLARHHFRRGRGLGRILVLQHLGEGRLLTRARVGALLLRYVPRRLARTRVNVERWGGELAPEHRRVRWLIGLGAAAAWAGLWTELLRPGRGRLGALLVDQRDGEGSSEPRPAAT